MSNNDEFYVTLPSTGSIREFTTNQANHFKVRLPQRLNLKGNHWKVALSSVTLPDSTRTLENHLRVPPETILMVMEWSKIDNTGSMTFKENVIRMRDLHTNLNMDTGEQFMQSLMAKFITKSTEFLGPGESYIEPVTKKKLIPDIRWKQVGSEKDLILDYSSILVTRSTPSPKTKLNIDIAVLLGWLNEQVEKKDHLVNVTHTLGPNLYPQLVNDRMSDDRDMQRSLMEDGRPVLWKVDGFLTLSPRCNWYFRNLDRSYFKMVGTPSRTLQIYSDVAASSMVGGQITDLLREVNYVRKGRGTVYVEPEHLQFHAIRRNVIETIEVQISETNGQLVQFTSRQPSAITLVFKNDV